MSGSRRNTKKIFTQQDKRSFYLVGSDVFLGLVFSATQNYYYKNNRALVTTPYVLFYNSQGKVIIDYSNSKNKDDMTYVSSFFNSLSSGETFDISNASYIEDASNISANISGTYSFESFEQDKLIKATVVSTNKINQKKDSYLSKFFTAVPQLNKVSGSVSSTQQRKNIIKNTLPNGVYSFKRLGARVGDYIDFVGVETNTTKKFKIIDLFTDTDGFETIQVDSAIEDENLIGESILVNLYFEGETDSNVSIDDKTYGTCVLGFGNNSSICIPAQNEFQCSKRIKQFSAFSSTYTTDSLCEDSDIQALLVQSQQPVIGITQTTAQVTITPQENLNIITSIRPVTSIQTLYLKKQGSLLTENGITLQDYPVPVKTTLKIILSDTSLTDYSFVFSSTDPLKYVTQLTDNVIISGLPGYSSSYMSVQSGTVARTIYLTSTDRTLSFKITIK
jgi:hypothetical protein